MAVVEGRILETAAWSLKTNVTAIYDKATVFGKLLTFTYI